ncbi:MAG: hypothetical protein WC460_05620 [Patescibacteria group bacterium]
MKSIVLMVAMDIEIPDSYQKNQGKLIVSGFGPQNASQAMRKLLSQSRPDFIVFTGFCAFVDDNLKTGDIIVANGYKSEFGEEIISKPEPQILKKLEKKIYFTQGKFQSFSHFVEERKIVAPDITAVDMETFDWAREATFSKIPFITVKVCCDLIPPRENEVYPIFPRAKPFLNLVWQELVKLI